MLRIFVVAILAPITIVIYFIPSIVAHQRNSENKTAIIILNIFLGWTILGWVGALIWACTDTNQAAQAYYPAQPVMPQDSNKITCQKCGALNDAEAKFCNNCGDALFQVCPKCSAKKTEGVLFCSACGAKYDDES